MASQTGASMGPWAEGEWGMSPRKTPILPTPLQGRGEGHCGPCSLASPCWTSTFAFWRTKPGPAGVSLYVRWERELKLLKEDRLDLQG